MKINNKKIALAILASSMVAIMWVTSTFAFWWNWNGQGRWQGQGLWKYATSQEKAKLQSLSWDEKTEYMNQLKTKYNNWGINTNIRNQWWQGQWMTKGKTKQSWHNEDPSSMIDWVARQDVSETEKTFLINQYGEEKMARDLYAYAYKKYWVNTFSNITKSEQKHMNAIKTLLDRYDISAPSDYASDNDLYNTLKAKIDESEKDAIEVGIMVEKVDIDSIVADIKATDNDDIKIILTNIGWASYNHLRWFINALSKAGYSTDISYSDYLSDEEVNSKWGWLKVKLAEKLEAEGVSLPEQASSKSIKANCDKKWFGWHSKWKGQVNWQIQNNWIDVNVKNKYKTVIKTKYSSFLDKMSEEKLKSTLLKIETFKATIKNNSKYSIETKKRYWAILEALKEVIEEKLWTDTDFLNDLLK